ncbi:helix-turn-helix domain-containing protein [Micromonospora sp. ATA32]|nr:helix-turn-helix domain-containing protein [Micromonospora sp. ATA32]
MSCIGGSPRWASRVAQLPEPQRARRPNPLRRAAERFQVSPTTARRWADRYRTEGVAGMRSSGPRRSPRRTPALAGAEGAASAGEAAVGTGTDRRWARAGPVDLPRGAAPGWSGPPGLPGPCHGPTRCGGRRPAIRSGQRMRTDPLGV